MVYGGIVYVWCMMSTVYGGVPLSLSLSLYYYCYYYYCYYYHHHHYYYYYYNVPANRSAVALADWKYDKSYAATCIVCEYGVQCVSTIYLHECTPIEGLQERLYCTVLHSLLPARMRIH
jgi:hypothetical protein